MHRPGAILGWKGHVVDLGHHDDDLYEGIKDLKLRRRVHRNGHVEEPAREALDARPLRHACHAIRDDSENHEHQDAHTRDDHLDDHLTHVRARLAHAQLLVEMEVRLDARLAQRALMICLAVADTIEACIGTADTRGRAVGANDAFANISSVCAKAPEGVQQVECCE
eukprot:1237331-Prymnesium_polylepis.5